MLIKKIKNYLLLAIISLIIACQPVEKKELSMVSVFSNHMVLQQQEEVAFWGIYNPKEKVTVTGSWGEESVATATAAGNWALKLPTPKAGGPFEVTVATKDSTTIFKDVMIGEVWLASGQSNMEWKIDLCEGCIDNQEEEIENANNKEIRMFTVPLDLTGEKLKDASWLVTTSENARNFSAAAYFFARKLHQELNVPIGIVNTSWGGTRVEAWTSSKKLKTLEATKDKTLPASLAYFDNPQKIKAYNDSIAALNEQLFGFKTVNIPKFSKDMEDWVSFDLDDRDFIKNDFDDSSWDVFEQKMDDAYNPNFKGTFETVFAANDDLLSNGVIWFRTKITVENTNEDYYLILNDGIDDADQTYFNGELVGNTVSWNGTRNYKIAKELLKKGENVIAIRMIDTGGGGGMRGEVVFKNSTSSQVIPFNAFKYKHQAFCVNGQFVIHHSSTAELIKNSSNWNENIKRGVSFNSPNTYSILFNRMLLPVVPYTIKGSIWYQGENNVGNFEEYNELLNGMIEDWRMNWGYDFPFYYAQIAPFQYGKISNSQGLRDAQRKTLKTTPKTGMAILLDAGEEEDIHPHNKQVVGLRLALLALDKDYGKDIVSSGPLYKSHQSTATYIDVEFDEIGSGLMFKDNPNDFEIAGDDGVFYNASAQIIDNKVRVSSNKVKNPKTVRYGWKNWVIGSLFNKEGLPASSFSSE